MNMKLDVIDLLFLLSLLFLYFLPKKSKKFKWFWIIPLLIFLLNIGIRVYLIKQKHENADTITGQQSEITVLKKKTEQLATRDTFKPLSKELEIHMLKLLSDFRRRHQHKEIKIDITVDQGRQRQLLAYELNSLLMRSGFKTTGPRVGSSFFQGSIRPHVTFRRNIADAEIGWEFLAALRPLFKEPLQVNNRKELESGHFKIHIVEKPYFSSDGVVSFH